MGSKLSMSSGNSSKLEEEREVGVPILDMEFPNTRGTPYTLEGDVTCGCNCDEEDDCYDGCQCDGTCGCNCSCGICVGTCAGRCSCGTTATGALFQEVFSFMQKKFPLPKGAANKKFDSPFGKNAYRLCVAPIVSGLFQRKGQNCRKIKVKEVLPYLALLINLVKGVIGDVCS